MTAPRVTDAMLAGTLAVYVDRVKALGLMPAEHADALRVTWNRYYGAELSRPNPDRPGCDLQDAPGFESLAGKWNTRREARDAITAAWRVLDAVCRVQGVSVYGGDR